MHPDLTGPGSDRAEVHQATGMVTVQATVVPAEALVLLRAHAFVSGSTRQQVSHDVVTSYDFIPCRGIMVSPSRRPPRRKGGP